LQIDVVNCKFDGRVYVRKAVERRLAFRTRDVGVLNLTFNRGSNSLTSQQCNPQLERDILLLAHRQNSIWAPHLLCAFQTATHLNLVMNYAEGGTLWDVLESSPFDGRIPEEDLHWWLPQVVSALAWCHAQGYVHRYVY